MPTRSIPQGEAIAADVSGVVLASRGAPEISVTDSHAGAFIKNELTLLCEVAAAAVVSEPDAVRKVEVEP